MASWNAGAQLIEGYAAEEIIGQHFSRFHTEEDRRAGRPEMLVRRAVADGRCEDEGWRVRKDGSRFWATVVLSALRDDGGRLRGFAEVTREAVRQESEKASQLVADLRRTTAELERAVRSRDDFLSIASHELKTPLTPLQLHVQGLLRYVERAGGSLPIGRVAQRLASIERQVVRLAELIDELLDISQLTGGSLSIDPEEVDAAAVVREVTGRYTDALEHAGCALTLHAPARIIGRWDRQRLDRVITNLLTNAIKYGGGKPIEIEVREDGASMVIAVRDHGIGIASEDRERVFGKFERAVSPRHFGGFGLGLWITSQIVQAFDGSIEVESRPGEGATFRVILPLRPFHAP